MPIRSGPPSESSEETLTTAPALRAIMPGSAARMSVAGVVTWMAMERRTTSGSISAKDPYPAKPALLTSSDRRGSAATRSASRATSAFSVRSATTTST